MSIVTAPRTGVKATLRRKRIADEIILWTIANRQTAKDARDNRVGITADAWKRMSPPDRRAVGRRLAALGCPRLGPKLTSYGRFAAFIDEAVNGVALPETSRSDIDLSGFAPPFVIIHDGHRPTAAPDFSPTPEQMAEDFGYSMGFGGIEAPAPDGLDADQLEAYLAGFARGREALDAERDALLEALAIEQDAVEEIFGNPEMTWHPAELAEARSYAGHPA